MPHTTFTPAQVDQLRRDAKRLARSKSIKLGHAQTEIALSQGFRTWSLLIKHSANTASPPQAKFHQPEAKARFYLHGDQVENKTDEYFCRQCDLFVDASHFTSEHGEETYERALQALESWTRSASESQYQRPTAAPNILLEEAIRRRDHFQMTRSAFHRWLEHQRDRDDAIGDLAQDALNDKRFPTQEMDLIKLLRYLRHRNAVPEALRALKDAWRAFHLESIK